MAEIKCEVCHKEIAFCDERPCEIRRGDFEYDLDDSIYLANLKFQIFICHSCYLNDPDFCRFMNKIGCRTR